MHLFILLIMTFILAWPCAASEYVAQTTITIDPNDPVRWQVNGQPFKMFGIRVASASQDLPTAIPGENATQHLIAQLDEYKAHKVNAVAVTMMGSLAGYSDPFEVNKTDGKVTINVDHANRIEQIIKACDNRGMVVVLSIFYQRRAADDTDNDGKGLDTWKQSQEAVRTTANWIKAKGLKNVILNIANEQNSNEYDNNGLPWKRVREIKDLIDMVRIAKAAHPALIVGAGGFNHGRNDEIVVSNEVDALLFDSSLLNNKINSGELYQRFVQKIKQTPGAKLKPMVNIEMFGGWTKKYDETTLSHQGYFPEYAKDEFKQEVNDAYDDSANPGLSVFFHSSPWCQGPGNDPSWPIHYDLAGQGTQSDQGMRWWFEYVRDSGSTPVIPPQNSAPVKEVQGPVSKHVTGVPSNTTPSPSGATFKEVQGLVSMEAEHADTITGWTTVAGQSGSALEDAGGSLSYSIRFSQPGDYTVYLLARYTGDSGKERNDCKIKFNGEKLYGSNGVLRPDGMRTHAKSMDWSFLPKGPGAHTPGAIKNLPVFLRVPAAGDYPFVISSRSIGFVVDKIVLKLNGGKEGKPTGSGPEETIANRNRGNAGIPTGTVPTKTVADDTPPAGLIFSALNDFPIIDKGAVSYYKDKGRGVLAINASVVANRGKFARAELNFTGTAGKYDVTITTSTEIDGESNYRLLINGVKVGEYQNPHVEKAGDHKEHTHTWDGIHIPENATIAIESDSNSNGLIPEAGGFAWARGRWKRIELKKESLRGGELLPPPVVQQEKGPI